MDTTQDQTTDEREEALVRAQSGVQNAADDSSRLARESDSEAKSVAADAIEAGKANIEQTAEVARGTAQMATDAGHAVVDEQAELARDALQTGLVIAEDTAGRTTDRMAKGMTFWSEQARDLAQKSSRNAQVMAEYGGVVAQGLQEISSEWMSLARSGSQQSVERLNAMLQARSPRDVVIAHSSFVRASLENLIKTQERIAQVSLRLMSDAAQHLTFDPKAERFQTVAIG